MRISNGTRIDDDYEEEEEEEECEGEKRKKKKKKRKKKKVFADKRANGHNWKERHPVSCWCGRHYPSAQPRKEGIQPQAFNQVYSF